MSKSSGGVPVKLIGINNNNTIIEFKNKSLVAKELNISLLASNSQPTVSRRIKDEKVHSIIYPRVKLIL